MLLKTLRFVSVLCAALVMAPTVAHDLEIAGKQQLSGEEWLQVQHTFYGVFAIVGGVGEMLGLISTGVLAYLLRKRRTGFVLTLIAALCFAGTLPCLLSATSRLRPGHPGPCPRHGVRHAMPGMLSMPPAPF